MICLDTLCLLINLCTLPITGDAGIPKWVFIVMAVSIIAIIALLILGRVNDKKSINDLPERNADHDTGTEDDNNKRTQF